VTVVAVASGGGRPSTVASGSGKTSPLAGDGGDPCSVVRDGGRPSTVVAAVTQWRDSRDLRFKLNASQSLMEYTG